MKMMVSEGMDTAGSKRMIETGGSGVERNQDSTSSFLILTNLGGHGINAG